MRCRGRRNGVNLGVILTAFGVGLIVAFCCPKGVIIALLATALVIMGIACGLR
ncbi:MAG: hypothetical protein MJ120_03185 [Clostridia bacterium]|nr:hypothetical protein [Clostridia bacterium]